MKKLLLFIIFIVLLYPATVSAHVTVRPDSVGVGSFQTFTVSVPSEKDIGTTEIRLLLPDNLEFVTPTVKSGWTVEVLTHNFPSGPHPYEIIWKNGNIPAHYRDDFTFSAKVPAETTTLAWKAYQTYSDKTTVAWELDPGAKQPSKDDGTPDFSAMGPYSQTRVVDDLSAVDDEEETDFSLPLSIVAMIISISAFLVAVQRKKK